jgi:hypothetical protein
LRLRRLPDRARGTSSPGLATLLKAAVASSDDRRFGFLLDATESTRGRLVSAP